MVPKAQGDRKALAPSAEGETSAQQDPKTVVSEVCSPKKNKGTNPYGTRRSRTTGKPWSRPQTRNLRAAKAASCNT